MKKFLHHLILMLLLCKGVAWGQEPEVETVKEEIKQHQNQEIKPSKETVQDILSRLNALEEKNNDKTSIGIFKIRKFAYVFKPEEKDIKLKDVERIIKHYENEGVTGFSTNTLNHIEAIDSVRLFINEGVIEHIKVYTDGGNVFYNTKAPIQLLTIENRFDDQLINPYDSTRILLKNVISFDADRRFNYFPDEQSILLSNKPNKEGVIINTIKLDAANNINSLLNIQVYSDLLALFGDQPNGLVQFEASTKFYLHRGNFKNKFAYLPLDVIEPFFHFNKVNNKFDTIQLSTISNINRLELYRRSTYSVGLSTNILRWDWRPSNTIELKAGYYLSSGNIVVDNNKTEYTLHNPYFEVALKNKKLNNFGIDLRVRYLFQKLNENSFIQNDEWNRLFSYRATLFYFPNKKEDSKFFLRFINYLNLSNRSQDFKQLQFGYQQALKF